MLFFWNNNIQKKFQILQLLCICAISQKDLLMRSCFKIMLAMCIVDVITLTFNAIFTGFLSIIGASICVYPVMMSIGGHLAFGKNIALFQNEMKIYLAINIFALSSITSSGWFYFNDFVVMNIGQRNNHRNY
ncbi:unnamed protein product [Toxocara canis]|uniref:Uncharacterized protein n=1 Tax=Toxocara canis TaxID=6265 RepID=A0A3P7F456_TOXCA|nr:unnamed protein product [Toxocara canis]